MFFLTLVKQNGKRQIAKRLERDRHVLIKPRKAHGNALRLISNGILLVVYKILGERENTIKKNV